MGRVVKFLFVFHDRPDYYGGPIVNARRLLPELRRRGHEVGCLILYGGSGASSVEFLEVQGVDCFTRSRAGTTERHVDWILEKLSELQPDIFVPNNVLPAWFAARWAREAGIPSIAVMRSDEPFCWAMVSEFVMGAREWAFSGLVCVADSLRNRVEAMGPATTQLCTIPSGVPLAQGLSDQDGPLKLVYVGRLVQESKRVLELVDALGRVISVFPEVRAAMIGDGDQYPAVRQRIDVLGLSERIQLLGNIPNEVIQERLADYDVLVLLSDYEGTPGAVMDGMAVGLIPVCLDIPGGVRELVLHEQTGLLVQDRQEGFLEAISRLVKDKSLRRYLSENARRHIEANFSLGVAADRWEVFAGDVRSKVVSKRPLVIPKNINFPPVHPQLAKEDRRYVSLYGRVIRFVRRKLQRWSEFI